MLQEIEMVNPSTANALNKRANSAVKSLTRWTGFLRDELSRQAPAERLPGTSKYAEACYPETIELKRKDVELLADDLQHIRRELGGFTRPA
jgi:hypothetical protein